MTTDRDRVTAVLDAARKLVDTDVDLLSGYDEFKALLDAVGALDGWRYEPRDGGTRHERVPVPPFADREYVTYWDHDTPLAGPVVKQELVDATPPYRWTVTVHLALGHSDVNVHEDVDGRGFGPFLRRRR